MDFPTLWRRRRIVEAYIAFLNGEPFTLEPGMIHDSRGEPVLTLVQARHETKARAIGRQIFALLTQPGGRDAVEAHINARGLRICQVSVVGDESALAENILRIGTGDEHDLACSIANLASTTPAITGDALSHRIEQCAMCERFFLRRTRRPARFCQDRCRWRGRRIPGNLP